MTFAELVRSHRRRLGLTQEELAAAAGVNVRTIGKLEAGQIVNPRPATIRLLADAFVLVGADRERLFAAADTEPVLLASPSRGSGPAQLPLDVAGFVGRTDRLTELDALVGAGAVLITAIRGAAGVGKTALAVHWGHRARSLFPDGQLYANMRGYAEGRPASAADVLGQFLRALEVAPDRIPSDLDELAALFRSRLDGQRILILLDNVRSPDQVRPLLPGRSGCLALITSRDALDSLVALDGARRLDLDVLSLADAIALLAALLGEERVRAEPAAAADLAAACSCLPLALRIVAAQLIGHPRRSLAEQVRALLGDPLAALKLGGDPAASVAAAFDLSYGTLPAEAAAAFRALSLAPAQDLGLPAIAAMIGRSTAETTRLLTHLSAASMVTEPSPGRFGLHDLARRYGVERAEAADTAAERAESLERLMDWYACAAVDANLVIEPIAQPRSFDRRTPPEQQLAFGSALEALHWFEDELAALLALTRFAAEHRAPLLRPLVQGQTSYLLRTYRAATLIELSQLAYDVAAATDDPRAMADHAQSAGIGYSLLRQLDRALPWYERALTYNRQLGEAKRILRTYVNLGAVHSEVGQLEEAVRYLRLGLELARSIGDRTLEGLVLGNLGYAYQVMRSWDQAIETLTEALAIQRDTGNLHGECLAEGNLGTAHLERGSYPEALVHLETGLRLAEELGDQMAAAQDRLSLGDVYRGLGDPVQARVEWQIALTSFSSIGHPEAEEAQTRLAGPS